MKNAMELVFQAIQKKNSSVLDELQVSSKADTSYVFLSVSDFETRAKVTKGKGTNVSEAIKTAVENYLNHKPSDHEAKDIKLDVITEFAGVNEKNSSFDFSKGKVIYNSGVNGLMFGEDFELVFSPQEVECYGVVENRRIKRSRLNEALSNQLDSEITNVEKGLEIDNLYKFTTDSYYYDGEHYKELYRGNHAPESLSKKEILESLKLTKNNYFRKVVNKKGKFNYNYLPAIDEKESRYNILRHAGTMYSMLETYEITPGEKLLEKIKLAADFLANSVESTEINGVQAKVLVERDVNKLGGNALAIVALAKYTTITKDEVYIPLMQELATWIKAVQNESGDFSIHKQIFSTKEVTDFRSDFYNGEAILGLIRLYELDQNKDWLEVAEKATDFMVLDKNKDATPDTIHHDHWLLYGIKNIDPHINDSKYYAHAVMMARSIMDSQYRSEEHPTEWIGGFPPQVGTLPKSVPVSCKTEGLCNVYHLAKKYKDDQLASDLLDTITHSVKFALQMQLKPEKVMYFPNKRLTLGAFHNKFKSIELRNDFTQHNISSCIGLYKILKNKTGE
ncbi:hypothetical protein [Halalkalibacillus halophilus]|uniref:hypothetical protein n=1 Tax=Halalkalibacillus halophilus TaxID=392827 RepID=UPI000411EC56|nr:hypothetical protein [Halalkalibacillus halophilus]